MSSQEEYLDNLLKDIENAGKTPEAAADNAAEGLNLDELIAQDVTIGDLIDGAVTEVPMAETAQIPEEEPLPEDVLISEEEPAMEEIQISEEEPSMEEIQISEEEPAMENIQIPGEEPSMENIQIFEDDSIAEGEREIDELLKADEVVKSEEDSDFLSVDDTVSLSEEDIEKMLSAGRKQEDTANAEELLPGSESDDLMNLLQDAPEEELQDIHDMLEKADQNVAVSDDVAELLEAEAEPMADWLMDEIEEAATKVETKLSKVEERKRLKEEKKQAKAAKKQAKKEAKALKKRMKAAESNEEPLTEFVDLDAGAVLDEAEDNVDDIFQDLAAIGDEFGIDNPVDQETQEANIEDIQPLDEAGADTVDLFGVGEESSETLSDEEEPLDLVIDAMDEVDGDAGVDVSEADVFGSLSGLDDIPGLDSLVEYEGLADIDVGPDNGVESDLLGALGAEASLEAEQSDEKAPGEPKKKKGLIKRIIDFLTETDEDDEKNKEIILSEENENILRDIDNEKGKKKKEKKKKNKKGEAAPAAEGEGGDEIRDINDDKGGGKAKKKKEKKPKPKKMPKLSPADAKPEKKLSPRRVSLIFLICITIGVVLFILVNVTVDFSDKQAAAKAYNEGDYETCYQNLVGKNLSENQQIMLGKSESILRIRLWLSEYELLEKEGSNLEALDSLIQSVNAYPKLYQFSSQYNATGEVAAVYTQMLAILENQYGLSEGEVLTIAAEPSDIEYTRMVMAVLNGTYIGETSEGENGVAEEVREPLTDELPEEDELFDMEFVDNN